MLEIKNYKKYYNSHLILEIPELNIPKGIHWILGKNGSGKSTLFKSISGIIPYEGTILFQGKNEKDSKYRFWINYSEAEPKFPEVVSASDVLNFIANAKKAPVGQLEHLIKYWEMNTYWKNPISTYSSGMLKKVSLVSAFLGSPQLIILDEPFILVDVQSTKKIIELINEYHKKSEVSFLMSSHQELDAEDIKFDSKFQVKEGKIHLL